MSIDNDFNPDSTNPKVRINIMDDKTFNEWAKTYGGYPENSTEPTGLRSAIQEALGNTLIDPHIRDILDKIADNLTPEAVLMVASSTQAADLSNPKRAADLHGIVKSICANKSLPKWLDPTKEQEAQQEEKMSEPKITVKSAPKAPPTDIYDGTYQDCEGHGEISVGSRRSRAVQG